MSADLIALADVVAIFIMYYIFVADVLPKDYVYPLFTVGRCYHLIFVVDVKNHIWQMLLAKWQME